MITCSHEHMCVYIYIYENVYIYIYIYIYIIFLFSKVSLITLNMAERSALPKWLELILIRNPGSSSQELCDIDQKERSVSKSKIAITRTLYKALEKDEVFISFFKSTKSKMSTVPLWSINKPETHVSKKTLFLVDLGTCFEMIKTLKLLSVYPDVTVICQPILTTPPVKEAAECHFLAKKMSPVLPIAFYIQKHGGDYKKIYLVSKNKQLSSVSMSEVCGKTTVVPTHEDLANILYCF